MSDTKPSNPEIFPSAMEVPLLGGGKTTQSFPGMRLRDYFAGQALAGLLADPNRPRTHTRAEVAEDAYGMADAMLQQREKA